MKNGYLLDFAGFTDRKTLHAYIAKKLSFPEYYGGNLDALFDCLSEVSGVVVLRHTGALESLGEYGGLVRQVFLRADEEYEKLQIVLLADEQ